jgi:O-antigen/teichoic acid export membrane protein
MIPKALARRLESFQARAGTLAGWFQQGCGLIVAAVSLPFILDNSILTPAESGLWLAFQGVLIFVYLSDFGISFAFARQAAYTLTEDRDEQNHHQDSEFIETAPGWEGMAALYKMGNRLFRILGFIAVLLLVVVYELLLPLGKLLDHADGTTRVAWYLLGLSSLAGLQSRFYMALIDGTGRVYLTRFIGGCGQLLAGALIVVTLLTRPTLPLLGLSVLVAGVIQVGVLLVVLKRIAPNRLKPATDTPEVPLHKFWSSACPIGIMVLAGFFISHIQVPLIGSLLGASLVAPFYIAQKILHTFTQSLLHLVSPQLPHFTNEFSSGKSVAARARMQRTMLVFVGAGALGYLAFYLFSPWLVTVWLKKSSYLDSHTLAIISIDYFILNLGVAATWFVIAAGRTPFAKTIIIAAILNVIGIIVLAPPFGLKGVALAGLISGLLSQNTYALWRGWKLRGRLQRASES